MFHNSHIARPQLANNRATICPHHVHNRPITEPHQMPADGQQQSFTNPATLAHIRAIPISLSPISHQIAISDPTANSRISEYHQCSMSHKSPARHYPQCPMSHQHHYHQSQTPHHHQCHYLHYHLSKNEIN